MPPIEEQLKLMAQDILELRDRFELHNHSGMDSREIDYRRLKNKPIGNDNTINGALGAGGISIGANGSLKAGQTAYDTGTGFWLEYNNGTPRLSIGNSSANKLTWDGSTLSITGSFTASGGTIGGFTITATTISATNLTLTSGAANTANITVGTGATAGGINSANGSSDIVFWAGATFANRATAPFRVNAAGEIVHTVNTLLGNYTISTGGNIRSGQTAYNTGTGYFLEYNGGTPRFSIGDATTTNSMLWDGTNLIVNGSPISNQDLFGDGSDGDVTITGNSTLTSDMFYNNLTIDDGFSINPAGYRIFVKGTLTLSGTAVISRSGVNGGNGANGSSGSGGAGGTAGAALAAGSISGAPAGAAGGAGGSASGGAGTAGSNGTDTAKSIGVSPGGASGAGGVGGKTDGTQFTNGGVAGSAGSQTGTVYNKIHNGMAAYRLYDDNGTAYLTSTPSLGAGGGGGAGQTDGGSSGGGGGGGGASGGPGGIVVVFARIITGTGTIKAPGGNGGNGGNGVNGAGGNAGGGGGGGAGAPGDGGVTIVVYGTKSGVTISAPAGTIGTRGSLGTGSGIGAGGTNGGSGTASASGTTITIQV